MARPVIDNPDNPNPPSGPGDIELSPSFERRWKELGGSKWGLPCNNGHRMADGITSVVDFKPQHNAVATKTLASGRGGVFFLTGAIRLAWLRHDFRRQNLGAPTADPKPTHDGHGQYQTFERAVWVWHPDTGAHEVHGPIQALYGKLGGSAWGYPITDELIAPDGRGRFNHFRVPETGEEKSIYWSPETGAQPLVGFIRGAWLSYTGDGSLGYPASPELPTGNGTDGGRYQVFENCVYVWHASTGAHEVHGSIHQRYGELGGSEWGFPVTDETKTPDGAGRYNHFRDLKTGEERSIYWSPSSGAHEVAGRIRQRWAELGWELGHLGYPRGPEAPWPEGGSGSRQQPFQHGRMLYRAQDGATAPEPVRFDRSKGSGAGFRYDAHVEARFDGTVRFFGQARNVPPASTHVYEIRASLRWGGTTLSWVTQDSLPLVVGQTAKRSWNQSDTQPGLAAEYFALQHATFDVRDFDGPSGGGNPPAPPPPVQVFRFCVSSAHVAKHTRDISAASYDEARQTLAGELGDPGAGDTWNIGDGPCA